MSKRVKILAIDGGGIRGVLPAMVLADTVIRLVPGVVKEPGSLAEESFEERRLDYPHYTRPADFRGKQVPPVLLSGNHAAIAKWRREQAQARRRQPTKISRSSKNSRRNSRRRSRRARTCRS